MCVLSPVIGLLLAPKTKLTTTKKGRDLHPTSLIINHHLNIASYLLSILTNTQLSKPQEQTRPEQTITEQQKQSSNNALGRQTPPFQTGRLILSG